MPIYVNKEGEEVLFIHIPKNAGTSIETVLRENCQFEFLYSPNAGGLPCTPQHFHRPYLSSIINFKQIRNFAVVRHPLSRLVSEYRWRINKNILPTNIISFDQFIIHSLKTFLVNPFYLDNHLRPQCDFLLDNTKIFKLEDDISKIENYLSDFLNTPVNLCHANVSSGQDGYSLSKYALRLIKRIYQLDFERFDYSCTDLKRFGLNLVVDSNERLFSIFEMPKESLSYKAPKENVIWFFWHTNISEAPQLIKECYKSWVEKNPDYNVQLLDLSNLELITGFKMCYFDVVSVECNWSIKTEIIRLFLLYHFGGVWADASTLCIQPLITWLPDSQKSSLFYFEQPSSVIDKTVITWFLSASKGCKYIEFVLQAADDFFTKERMQSLKIDFKVPLACQTDDYVISKHKTGINYLTHKEIENEIPIFWLSYLFNDAFLNLDGRYNNSNVNITNYAGPNREISFFKGCYISKQTLQYDLSKYYDRFLFLQNSFQDEIKNVGDKCLPSDDINFLRDTALQLENYDLNIAYQLMSFTQKFRPNGKFISNKVSEYQEQLQSHQSLVKSYISTAIENDDTDSFFFNSDDSRSRIQAKGHRGYVGAPTSELWYSIGKLQYYFLISEGLKPSDVFLDIACGSLRLGQYIIPFLDTSNYYGIEAEPELVQLGLERELGLKMMDLKKPNFSFNIKFDFDILNAFDIAMAQSLFTHLTIEDIQLCFKKIRMKSKVTSRFYFTFFEGDSALNKAEFSHAHHNFSYSQSELNSLAIKERCQFHYIGGWNHPRGQMMAYLTFAR
ncbi:capsular polysaccharide synthesis protein [Shewanella aestuarii]|uniref:Sulfotransferase family 2 domain-containing protein n=1 Tax=Shewanella aestuarii TaxID=1028752 RepID=A0A6G9QM50_9GAMM|nr:capsular polysaccharide synthesis protein [Shewanella aestuarii]QIR15127.1 sulfotransferase family 2 domain-containing protein [Shewanella aestuarii]